jgi:hypothetical protein
MDEFENFWQEEEEQKNEELEEINSETPEYQIKEGVAKYNILCDLLGFYYHAKHGEPMADLFNPDMSKIEFSLK